LRAALSIEALGKGKLEVPVQQSLDGLQGKGRPEHDAFHDRLRDRGQVGFGYDAREQAEPFRNGRVEALREQRELQSFREPDEARK